MRKMYWSFPREIGMGRGMGEGGRPLLGHMKTESPGIILYPTGGN